MKTVYAIASARTIKYLTGAKAGQISHTFGYKSHWDETLKKFIEYFNTREEADNYLEQQLDHYLNTNTIDGNSWKLATRSLGAFAVKNEWGKNTKRLTVDCMNIAVLIIED